MVIAIRKPDANSSGFGMVTMFITTRFKFETFTLKLFYQRKILIGVSVFRSEPAATNSATPALHLIKYFAILYSRYGR